jgi:hypothetical protein
MEEKNAFVAKMRKDFLTPPMDSATAEVSR